MERGDLRQSINQSIIHIPALSPYFVNEKNSTLLKKVDNSLQRGIKWLLPQGNLFRKETVNDYSCLDSSTGGMGPGEEDEIDNVLLRDMIQSDYDDGEEGSGSEQQVTDDNNDDIPEDIDDNFVDFTAVLSSKKCVTTASKEKKRKNADVGDGREQEKRQMVFQMCFHSLYHPEIQVFTMTFP